MIEAILAAAIVTGAWQGDLNINGQKLAIVLHLSADSVKMDSPDQGAYGIPGSVYYNKEDSISIGFPALMATYRGAIHDGELRGKFKQGFATLPLNLTSGEQKLDRPQTPQPPFPYTTEEVTFVGYDGATLCGTLTLPQGGAPKTLAVMVTGSGQQNRDEELLQHKPFAVIADYLAREGIATFRYDDRGIGCSEGLNADLTTETNMLDAMEAVKMLRQRGVAKRYGILGHSEGGTIGFMAAGRYPEQVDFVVALAGTAISGDKVLAEQYRYLQPDITDAQVNEALAKARASSKWMEYFLDYNPMGDLMNVRCPVMALYGTLDRQVLAAPNISALHTYLATKKGDVIQTLPGLNHLFQSAKTGSPTEYRDITETISPTVLSAIAAWLKTQ